MPRNQRAFGLVLAKVAQESRRWAWHRTSGSSMTPSRCFPSYLPRSVTPGCAFLIPCPKELVKPIDFPAETSRTLAFPESLGFGT